ncbi:MAG: hypothetical protein OXN21_10715 [Chloroflexota bacterium]|nr:hypothetical protein [Chloroflexota bacterium]
MKVRYPNVHVPLTWRDPEPDSILRRVQRALQDAGASDEEIAAYTREATSRCYNHLLFTTMMWVGTTWETMEDELSS